MKQRLRRSLHLLAALTIAGAMLLSSCYGEGDPLAMAENSGHFLDEDASPEMSDEGIKCALIEAYYTNNGSLVLNFRLGNGTAEARYLKTLDVTLKNAGGELIAEAATDAIDRSFVIPSQGSDTLSFTITPEYVHKSDDDLHTLTYEVTIASEVDVPSDATTSGETTSSTAAATTVP